MRSDLKPDLEAQIRVLTTEEGGRQTPLFSGYRGQFYYESENWDAEWYFKPDPANLGETVLARVILPSLGPSTLLPKLSVGAKFEIREGARTVATGTVLKFLGR